MNRLAEIEVFIAVVEAGTQIAAARRLNIAVSAIHRRLTDLEDRLGVALTYRTKQGTELTKQGEDYYNRCLRVIADLNEADALAGGEMNISSGLIKITLPQAFETDCIAPILNRFSRDNPKVQFEIEVTDRIVDLKEEQFDVAIRIDDSAEAKPNEEILFKVDYCVCASQDFWDMNGYPRNPKDLFGLPALAFKTVQGANLWSFRDRRGKLIKVPLNVRYVANSGSYLVEAAKAGLGVILEPNFVCGEAILKGDLVRALDDFEGYRRYAKIAYPANRLPSLRVQKLIEHFRVELSGYTSRCYS